MPVPEYDFSATMRVSLVPWTSQHDDPIAGPVTVEHNQFRVFLHCDTIPNPHKCLMVGIIGKQVGARFCPVDNLYRFHDPQRQWIAKEAVRLHGAAREGFVELEPAE